MNGSSNNPYICPVCDDQFETQRKRGGHFGACHPKEAKQDALIEQLQAFKESRGRPPIRDDIDECPWGSASTIESVFGSWNAGLEAAGITPVRKRLSTDELIVELERLASTLGRTPRMCDMREVGRYSRSVYRRRFGSWNDALAAAGLEPNSRNNLSSEQLLQELERVASTLGEPPTKDEFDRTGRFCSATYVNRFGSWNAALEAVGCKPSRVYNPCPEALLEELKRVGDVPDNPPVSTEEVASEKYSISTFERTFGSWNNALRAAGYKINQHQSVPEKRLLSALERLATILGRTPTVGENREMGEYSFNAYQNTFGSWNQALGLVDLELNSRQDIPKEELIDELNRLATEYGRPPTVDEMDALGRFSRAPYVRTFGTWMNCLEEAGFSTHQIRRYSPHPIYGVGWNKRLRESIRERDRQRCCSCGMTEETHREEYSTRLHVHHICGARRSSNPAVFNAPRNLVTLCNHCHHKAERYAPGLPPEIDQPGRLD